MASRDGASCKMSCRLAQPARVIDIGRIAELAGVSRANGSIHVGSLTRHVDIAGSDVLKEACPILAEAAAEIGDPQVRNRGTR